jgi:ABC-2 type transport system permease protein
MDGLLALLKVSLNSAFGISAFFYKCRKEKKTIWLAIGFVALMALSFAPLVYLYIKFLGVLYEQASMLGQPHVVLALATVFSQLIVLMFGIYYLMSNFYFAQDLSILIPLPLRPGTVLTAKFVTVLVSEWLTTAVVAIPAIVVYGISARSGVLFWLISLVIFLLLPAIPIVIGAVLVIILMRVTNLTKNRDLLRVLGGLVLVAVIFASQYFLSQLPSDNEEEFLQNILMDPDGLVYVIAKRFPPALWASKAMAYAGTMNGLTNLVYFLGLTVLSIGILYILGEKFFYAGLIGGQETARKKRVSTRRAVFETEKANSPLGALLKREFRLFFRNPIFIMTAAMNILVVPIAMVMPILFSGELKTMLEGVQTSLQTDPKIGFIASFVIGAFMIGLTVVNSVSATSISREGKLFWISKMIPVDPKLQVWVKFLHSYLYTLLSAAMVVLIVVFLIPIPWSSLLAGVFLGLVGSILANALGLIADLWLPNLKWTDPQKAMKGNWNSVWVMLFTTLLLVGGGFLFVKLLSAGVNLTMIYVGYFVAISVLSVASVYYLLESASRRYVGIEV